MGLFYHLPVVLFLLLFPETTGMGNCIPLPSTPKNLSHALPIEAQFKLPSVPSWPSGGAFATGKIDLGGLQVIEIRTFRKIWASYEGGPDNLGATIFEAYPIPEGFFPLGCYGQSNNRALYGSILVAKDVSDGSSASALEKPTDYSLVWSSQSLNPVYIWLPIPPDGYHAVGHIVTTTSDKPSLDGIRCVRSDLTDQCESHGLIWSTSDGLNVYDSRPTNKLAKGVSTGAFRTNTSIACLKNEKLDSSVMPNLAQVQALVKAYSPWVYFHPDEEFLPSTVSWFFTNGALLYKKGEESHPTPIDSTGSNLPQDGSNDDAYWIDLPSDEASKEKVKKGDLQTAGAYFHIKPMFGATFTDIAIWLFYPFNGPARAKVGIIKAVSLGKIGEHVGDWEHVTLRISNFNGELRSVYFSQHNGGQWVDASQLEFPNGNKAVVYASLNGHSSYAKAGLVMQGSDSTGIRNDAAKSNKVMDTGVRYEVISADYLGITEPSWLNYKRKWGPKISYDLDAEVSKVEKFLLGKLKSDFKKLVSSLPREVLGEEGPTGPKMKGSWDGDEA